VTEPKTSVVQLRADSELAEEPVLKVDPADRQERLPPHSKAGEEELIPMIRRIEVGKPFFISLVPFQSSHFIHANPIDVQAAAVILAFLKESLNRRQAMRIGNAMMLRQDNKSALGTPNADVVKLDKVIRWMPNEQIMRSEQRGDQFLQSRISAIADGNDLKSTPRERLKMGPASNGLNLIHSPVNKRKNNRDFHTSGRFHHQVIGAMLPAKRLFQQRSVLRPIIRPPVCVQVSFHGADLKHLSRRSQTNRNFKRASWSRRSMVWRRR
jgi:hypothetical protein